MTYTAAPQTSQITLTISADEMAIAVVLVEQIVKQQQLLKQEQRLISTQARELEALKKENAQLKKENTELRKENTELKDSLDKLKGRTSKNSSVPPSQDIVKKPSDKSQRKQGKKRGPKYNHSGKTRNGFGEPDHIEQLLPSCCPACGDNVEQVAGGPKKVQQVAELVEKPVEIWEYQRGRLPLPILWLVWVCALAVGNKRRV